jgi:pimeloyl-ACP methyl ester carboxylesterase
MDTAAGTPFGALKQVDAGVLNIGYAEAGPADGPAVILLHGWPYDIHSFADVTPLLASAGYRVIVPYLRGYGITRFLSDATFRNGQQSVLAVDVIALMDAVGIGDAIIGGFDWGARTANVVAALWPGRCKAMVSVSGYLIGSPEAGKAPLLPSAELAWWYQFYFATERGRAGYDKYRREFAQLIWHTASPKWNFDDATFNQSATSFDNADHVSIVIHNYRWRLGHSRPGRYPGAGEALEELPLGLDPEGDGLAEFGREQLEHLRPRQGDRSCQVVVRAPQRRVGEHAQPRLGRVAMVDGPALASHGVIVPAGSDCARTLSDSHRPSGAYHSPADPRLIVQDVGQPCRTEAGDEAVDGDLHFAAVADWRAESDQDSAVLDFPAAASGLNHRSPVGDEDDVGDSGQCGPHLALGLRCDRRSLPLRPGRVCGIPISLV